MNSYNVYQGTSGISGIKDMKQEFKELQNEVLRKIGRNVVLYQQFEVMIKLLHLIPLNY